MRSAARLSSTAWNAASTVCRYMATLASCVARAWSVRARRSPASYTVSEMVPPTDQNRIGQASQRAALEPSNPPSELRMTLGK